MKMKMLLALCAILPSLCLGSPYAQIGLAGYDSKIGAGRSASAEIGYTHSSMGYFDGGLDISAGVFDAAQNTASGQVSWSGLAASASAHMRLIDSERPVTSFVGYQLSQTPGSQWDGRYGVGLTWHALPVKASLIFSPAQKNWQGVESPSYLGVSIKYRLEL